MKARDQQRPAERSASLKKALGGVVFAASLLTASVVRADCPPAAGECKQLVDNGSLGARIDLVIMGDGYTAGEKDKFFADAQVAADGILKSETYGDYAPVFNVFAMYTPSAQSGADDPSAGVFVDTAFDGTYDTSGIDYLISINYGKALQELNTRFPEKDVALCLVNAAAYGGSGGPVAVVSLDANSLEVARHELGHTLAGLADEYTAPYPGYPDGDPEPNVALESNLDPVKWSMWLTPGVAIPTPISAANGDHDPIGAYEGARYKATGVFRPAPNCLMRELEITFCPVCSEAMVLEFSKLSLLIDAPTPASPITIPVKGVSTFSATLPALSNLMPSWKVDGNPVDGTTASLALDPEKLGLADGVHTVELAVYDATPKVRNDPQSVMTEVYTWDVTVDGTLPPNPGTGGGAGAGVGGSGGGGGSGGVGNGNDVITCGCRTAGTDSNGSFSAVGVLGVLIALSRRRRTRG
ncbi:MAG: hypothetical protein IPK82_19905 [Polyangiaceae bacterium]|nr:hypothetical protein [Polyangiaceae bacterium]